MPQVVQAYLHSIWWRPQENWGLNKGTDGRQTDEVFGLVREKHGRVYVWAPDGHVWWCCQIKGQAAVGLMAVVVLCIRLSFLYHCFVRYIIVETVQRGKGGWMWIDFIFTVISQVSAQPAQSCSVVFTPVTQVWTFSREVQSCANTDMPKFIIHWQSMRSICSKCMSQQLTMPLVLVNYFLNFHNC